MSIRYVESFDQLADIDDLALRNWTVVKSSATGMEYDPIGGRRGNGCIKIVGSKDTNLRTVVRRVRPDNALGGAFSAQAACSIGFAWKWEGPVPATGLVIGLVHLRSANSASEVCHLRISYVVPNWRIEVFRNTNFVTGANFKGDGTFPTPGTWYFIELVCSSFSTTTAASIDRTQIWVDGVLRIQSNAANSVSPTVFDEVHINRSTTISTPMPASSSMFFQDLHNITLSGNLPNTRLGDCRVDVVRPVSVGTENSFSLFGAATKPEAVDLPNDGSTSTVFSSTPGHTQTFKFEALPHNPATIYAAVPFAVVAKAGAASRVAKTFSRYGSTVNELSTNPFDLTLDTTFRFITQPLDGLYNVSEPPVCVINPVSGVYHTKSELLDLETGVKVES